MLGGALAHYRALESLALAIVPIARARHAGERNLVPARPWRLPGSTRLVVGADAPATSATWDPFWTNLGCRHVGEVVARDLRTPCELIAIDLRRRWTAVAGRYFVASLLPKPRRCTVRMSGVVPRPRWAPAERYL